LVTKTQTLFKHILIDSKKKYTSIDTTLKVHKKVNLSLNKKERHVQGLEVYFYTFLTPTLNGSD